MATIFNKYSGEKGPAGALIKAGDDALINVLKIEGLEFSDFLLATSMNVSQSQVVQYLKTLNGKIYGYSFGDDVGTITATGTILYSPKCSFDSRGAQDVKDFYENNNVYDKTGPIKVTLGSLSFEAYLKSYTISIDNNQFNLGQFSVAFDILPDNK